MRTIFIILSTMTIAMPAMAAPIYIYRALLNFTAELLKFEKEAKEKVADLRQHLGTSAITYPAILAAPKTVKGNKRTSSGIVKTILGRAAEELRRKEDEGAPPPFDPSKFDFELEQDARNLRYEFCEKTLGKDYPHVVNELVYDHLKTSEVAAPTNVALAEEKRLLDLIRPLIAAPITQKLGTLTGADFLDGHVIKLYFLPAKGEEYPISFSILSSVRTMRDKYFLITLECLRRHLEVKSTEEKPADSSYQALTKILFPVVAARVKQAGEIHNRLASLTRSELNSLLDLFLALHGDELLTGTEMEIPDDPSTWSKGTTKLKIGATPSFPMLMYDRTQPAIALRDKALAARNAATDPEEKLKAERDAAAAMAPAEENLADYEFYTLFYEQTEQLIDHLTEEASREILEKKIIKDMGGN